jgi:hypothetical protein
MLDDTFGAISEAAMKAASPAADPSVATSSGPETVLVSRGYSYRWFGYRAETLQWERTWFIS